MGWGSLVKTSFGAALGLWFFCAGASGPRVLSYNLHGYHPYFEGRRYFQERSGKISPAPAHLFYFTREELRRGVDRRNRELAQDLDTLGADVLILQEIVSGWGEAGKTCDGFYRSNSAQALARAWGHAASVASACRGNLGWFTGPEDFADRRIMRRGRGGYEVVHDFGANPYPNGLVLEGTAMVARAPWALRDNVAWLVPSGGEKFFFQSAELFSTEDTDGSWRLLVNVHGSHKVAHFESAVAVRAWLQGYLARHELRHKLKGVVIAGDFNARLDEESMQPWLLQDPASFDRQLTAIELKALNDDQNYKPWATISPSTWAWSRINKALDIFESVLRGPWLVLSDNLTSHARAGTCDAKASNGLSSACVDDYGIDHVLTSEADPTLNSFVLYPDTTDENTLQRLSDHPGIVVDFP